MTSGSTSLSSPAPIKCSNKLRALSLNHPALLDRRILHQHQPDEGTGNFLSRLLGKGLFTPLSNLCLSESSHSMVQDEMGTQG